MVIVFDMDNTLTDELGATVRPGIVALLERLKRDGHRLVLWTNSKRTRAREILALHGLQKHFQTCVFREDYDPKEQGVNKDIRKVEGQVLIDDDPAEVRFVESIGRRGILIKSYRKGNPIDRNELTQLYRAVRRSDGFLGKLFK